MSFDTECWLTWLKILGDMGCFFQDFLFSRDFLFLLDFLHVSLIASVWIMGRIVAGFEVRQV